MALQVKYSEPWQTVVCPWAFVEPKESRVNRLIRSPRPAFKRPQMKAI